MWLAVFYIWGSLLAFSMCDICPEISEDAASWIKLKPLGHCGDEDNLCPFQLTLPPLSIQLPRSFRELETMAKELQDLKEVVNQLKRDCQECKDRHSIERGEQKDHSEEEEKRPQSLRHNIRINETQSHSGEQVVRIFTSTLPQRDTSEGEGTVKSGVKRLNHSILESQRSNIDQRIDLNPSVTDQRSEISREVKIFNPSLDETPEDISEDKLVVSPTPDERELKSKESELQEPSLPRKKDNLQIATHGKLQPNNLRDGHAKNISSILAARRRVQNLPDVNRLSSISRDANTKTMDLSTSSGNRRVVKISGVGAPLRPKGSYINSRVVNVNSENRLKNPALVRKTNPQAGDMTVKTEPEESGFSPARSGIMRVKETGSHIPNTKPGAISRPIPSTDDQNKQDISRVSGPRTDDGHGLENAGQVTILREDNLRKVNKTEITRLPTKQSKENQGDVSHIATNKSISSVMNQAEQPNIFKEEKKHAGLIESLVVISSEAETSSKVDREDLPFRGRQVENKKYLNPNTETNNGQIDSTILDEAGSTFNERTVNPPSPDLKDKIQPGTFTEGPKEEIGINSLNAGTVKKDIPRHSKAILLEKDLVKPNLAPTVNSKLIDSTASLTSIVQSPAVDQGTRRILITPIKAKAKEELSKNSKDISKIPEVSQDNNGHVMPNLLRNPEMYPTTTIPPRGPKLRQPNIINKLSANRTVGVPLKLSIPFRNSNMGRKNGTGIIKQSYIRKKPISQTETNINRGFKTKVSTVTQFFSPTGATSTVKQEQKEEIKHIPQVTRSNILDNHWLNNNSSETQNAGDVQDLDMVQEDKYRIGDNSETVLISNIGNHAEDSKTQSEASNSPIGEKKSRILNLGTVDTSSQPPFEVKTSSGKKRPTASTLKKELSKKPGKTQFTTPALSFTDTDHDNGTKNIHTITSIQKEEIKHIPQVARSNVLDNHWLNNNSSETQHAGDVQDLDMVQEDKYQIGDNSETVLISNIGNHAEDSKTQSGASNSPIDGKESRILNLGTADTSSQPPFEVKTGSGKKRPTASTLKKELSKKPGTTQFTTPALSFTDTDHDDSTKNIHTITSTQKEEIKHIPQVARSNVLDNQWLNNNSSETQNTGDVQGLDKVQEDKYRIGDNSETVLLSNIGNHAEDSKTQSGASNSPIGGKESKILNLGTTDTSSQPPFEVKTGSGKKRPTASTLKKVLSKKPGTPALSFTDTGHDDGTKNIRTITSTHVEMAKNVSQETPISFENIGATRELELIQLNKDRVEGNPGEILSNPNSADTAQGYSEGSYTIPVVLETLTNVEEIKGSKLFSLSPEDTAEGFKSHAVSDEVTEREKVENKSNSTCLSDCNTTSTQQSTTQTRPPLDSGREKGPAQDCADYITKSRRNGVYRATPWLKNSTFPVFCDMESSGGGWTLIQRRFDGSTSFNRTWDEYKNGFGKLIGEFWLGNDKIHLLTKAKNMSLRIEIEDFEGVREYAHYDHFYVANESQQYRLSIGGYSGTAGNAMQFSEKYNHDQKLFTTPDRDNDHYPSGNCGAYYSSGWWFDACMSANLNGKYYQSKYKGVRNGIFWGTWHNITMEYYPTNERQAFKTVRMMIRPKNSAN